MNTNQFRKLKIIMEIALYNQINNPIEAIDRLGEWFAKSGMTGADNSNAGKVLAWECLAQRKSPVQILRRYDIIGGKLRDKALSIHSDFLDLGGKVKWINIGEDGKEAAAEFTLNGQTITYKFTIDMAMKQGLVKPNSGWAKTPGNMLRARCLSNGIAILAPGIVAGDDDNEVQPEPEKKIELKPAKEPAPVVEAQVVSAPAPAPEPSPAPTVTTEAKPVDKPAGKPAVQLLPDDVVAQLEQAMGEHAVKAGQWLIAQGWIKHGEGLANLPMVKAQRILKQTASFIRAVTGGAA